jgi:hypothetical protein
MLSRGLKLYVAVLAFCGSTIGVLAAGPVLGDGIGMIDGYDAARGAVSVGRQTLFLTPEATASLTQQLSALGWPAGTRFGARYNVSMASDGQPVIDSIHVFRPNKEPRGTAR